jgi:inorganic pyrophosphatase
MIQRWDDVQDITDVNKHQLKEFVHFFETYKNLKGKPADVQLNGYEGAEEARKAFARSIEMYTADRAKTA